MPTPKNDFPTTSGWLLPVAFALVIVGFSVSNLAALNSVHGIQVANLQIIDNVLNRTELMSRITHDFDRKRLLLFSHIREKTDAAMKTLEADMARVDADLLASLHSYRALSDQPVEHPDLEEAEAAIKGINAHVANVVSLSRGNLDVEADRELARVDQQVDDIDKTLEIATRRAHNKAGQAIAVIRSLHRRSLFIIGGLTLTATALGLFITGYILHHVRRWDRQIRDAATSLEERNRELNAFAGRVAHDLRGPLTAISLSASRFAEGASPNDRSTTVLRRGVTQMESIIQDLLMLSGIEGQLSGVTTQTEAAAAAVDLDLRPNVESAHGILRIDVAPARVLCSEGLLRQVLWNLGENAVKYRRLDVRLEIDIKGRVVGSRYEFHISDNGTGMSREEARHAFEPFFRGEQQRATPGTGLGLSIVKRVVEANGGRVSIDSSKGRGTTFIISLPLGAGATSENQPS